MTENKVGFKVDVSVINGSPQLSTGFNNVSSLEESPSNVRYKVASPECFEFDNILRKVEQDNKKPKKPLNNKESLTKTRKNCAIENGPKILLGVFYGVLTTIYLHFWLLKRVPSDPEAPIRLIISIVIGLLIGILLAILCVRSIRLRCTLCVAVPEMCTNRGRAVVISIITALLISGPIENIINNSGQMHNSTQCVIDKIKDISENYKMQVENYRGMLGMLEKTMKQILLTAEKMRDKLQKAKEQIDTILAKSKPLIDAYQGIQCLGGFINCERIKLSNPIDYDDYRNSSLSDVALIGAKNFNDSVHIVKTNDLVSMKDILKNFFVNLMKNFHNFTVVFNAVLSLSVFFIFRHANYYVLHYYTEDAYDNHLVDKNVVSKQETLLNFEKLYKWEKKYFIARKSVWCTAMEKSSFLWSLLPNIVLLVIVMCIAAGDYLLHSGINVITDYGSMSLYVVLPVKATSSRFGRQLNVSQFRVGHVNVSTQSCLPRAKEPLFSSYIAIFVLILLCFITSALQAYVRRMRSLICKYFYPDREREREEWLRSTIEKGRTRRPGKMYALMENAALKYQRRNESEIQFNPPCNPRSRESNMEHDNIIKLPYCAACKKRPALLTRLLWAIRNDPSTEEFKGQTHEFISDTYNKRFIIQLCDDCYPYRETAILKCELCKPCVDCQDKWYKTQKSMKAIK